MSIFHRKVELSVLAIANVFLLLAIFEIIALQSKEEVEDLEIIRVDGSSTVHPITQLAADEYMKKNSNCMVSVGVSGTGGGFKKFLRGEVHINNASRRINQKEIQIASVNKIPYKEYILGYDCIVIIKNKENHFLEDLKVEEIVKVFGKSDVKKWRQIRPEYPEEEIRLCIPGKESGTYDFFMKAYEIEKVRSDALLEEDDYEILNRVSNNPDVIGFVGFSFFSQNRKFIESIGLNNGGEIVKPSEETLLNGTYSDLTRKLYVYVNIDAKKKNEVLNDFMSFYLENVNEYTKESGYFPAELSR